MRNYIYAYSATNIETGEHAEDLNIRQLAELLGIKLGNAKNNVSRNARIMRGETGRLCNKWLVSRRRLTPGEMPIHRRPQAPRTNTQAEQFANTWNALRKPFLDLVDRRDNPPEPEPDPDMEGLVIRWIN